MSETYDADPAHEALLTRLRSVVAEADPVPDLVRDSAYAAFAMRAVDAELVALVRDSLVDDVVGVRAADTDVRLLSFESGEVSVELEVTAYDDQRALLGQVTGALAGTVRVETAAGSRDVELDELGRFVAEDLSAGRVRLHLTAESGRAVTTSWVTI